MKKITFPFFILLLFFFILFPYLLFYGLILLNELLPIAHDYDILSKDIQYKIVLGDELFLLTDKGLIEKGYIRRGICNTKISAQKKSFYFYNSYNRHTNKYTLHKKDLIISATLSTIVPFTDNIDRYSISPNGDFLLYNIGSSNELNNIVLLDIRTGKRQVLLRDFNDNHSPVWINDHQFLYQCSNNVNKIKLYLFDINLQLKKDMHMDGYFPGAVTPDNKKVLLTKKGKTVLYGIQSNSVETIKNKEMYIDNAIWLPNGEGFIHSETTWRDFADAFENPKGLYYYSLNKKKSIRLMKFFDLKQEGGFIVPPGISIQLEDTKFNKLHQLPRTKNKHIVNQDATGASCRSATSKNVIKNSNGVDDYFMFFSDWLNKILNKKVRGKVGKCNEKFIYAH